MTVVEVSSNAEKEIETTACLTTQAVDSDDDDIQIVRETRRPGSPLDMMPTDAVPPTSPTNIPLLNRKHFLFHLNFINL